MWFDILDYPGLWVAIDYKVINVQYLFLDAGYTSYRHDVSRAENRHYLDEEEFTLFVLRYS